MSSIGEILAGLGLLFVGLRLLSANLQQAVGGRIRQLMKTATQSALIGFAAGCVAGGVTQSSNAVAVISGNLVRSRVLTTREAVPVVAGGNVGTSLLVLLAAINLHIAVLFLIGLVGISFHAGLDKRAGLRDWMGVLLGLALLFLGIDFIKGAPRHLDITALAELFDGISPLLALTIGLVVAAVTQSSSTATILALAGIKAGFIDLDICFFVVLGANLGSGIATLLAAGALGGVGRQLCYVHILVKGLGTALLLLVWLGLDALGGDPSRRFADVGGGDPSASVSMLFLALQLAGALPVATLRTLVERIASRFSPPSLEDSISRPRYIDPAAIADPAGALELSGQEIAGLINRLPTLLPDLDNAQRPDPASIGLLARGSSAIAEETDRFVVDLIARGLSDRHLDLALGQQSQLEMLQALQQSLVDFSAIITGFETAPPLAFNLSEALRTLVMQLADTTAGPAEDFDFLIELTGDRSEHLNRIRRELAVSALGAEADAQHLVLATSLFERAVWLVRRIAIAMKPLPPGGRTDPALA
ncbi:phosphate:Na+ symporter [Kaistia soli DSM 19436]|uniref:Phosphate:Na+ symporter n=1 Tax=Kaistia soli DSM 19436 TaxID=1122133 RepID=A0A1M5A1N9_9HYPH|nr:Na/Pi symporter [Kaistia soli]SHF24131.1 phosphate:Na+ symporter [Kaistia soli DSM 19436]